MKPLISVGTRPEIIKMSPLIRVLKDISELVFIHSGQHYDFGMSKQFLTELEVDGKDSVINGFINGWYSRDRLHHLERKAVAWQAFRKQKSFWK